MGLKFTILGCGCSYGVPRPGNDWGYCDPSEPKNKRTRSSLMVQSDTTTLVVDTGQDFRDQMNRHEVQTVDAVCYTHLHADHTSGVDDIRIYAIRNQDKIPCYMNQETYEYFLESKGYLLEVKKETHPALMTANIREPFDVFQVEDIPVSTHLLDHGIIDSIGYRFGNVAYSLDMMDIADARTFDALEGIETWIVDGGAHNVAGKSIHARFDKIIELNQRVKARRVIMSSLTNRTDYSQASSELPDGYELAYDGMVIEG